VFITNFRSTYGTRHGVSVQSRRHLSLSGLRTDRERDQRIATFLALAFQDYLWPELCPPIITIFSAVSSGTPIKQLFGYHIQKHCCIIHMYRETLRAELTSIVLRYYPSIIFIRIVNEL